VAATGYHSAARDYLLSECAVSIHLELRCPFPSNIHPLTAKASERTLQWAREFGLVQDAERQRQAHSERFTWLVGRFFPRASESVLQLISDWTSWLFWHDDVCDETELGGTQHGLTGVFDRFFDILTGELGANPSSSFERALAEMVERFRRLAPDPVWMLRFATSVREYFDACIWEAGNRERGVVPSVGSFIPLRRCAGGMWIYLDFVELANGRKLSLELRKHRDVQRLVQITNNVASWHNDLFSLSKEMRAGDVHNLVTALQVEMDVDLEEARQVAIGYANAEVEAFVRIEQKLKASGIAALGDLDEYVSGLKDLMRGNLDWSAESGRYVDFGRPDAKSDIRELLGPRRVAV
jgi:5-epi-alpha-selinene synthase